MASADRLMSQRSRDLDEKKVKKGEILEQKTMSLTNIKNTIGDGGSTAL